MNTRYLLIPLVLTALVAGGCMHAASLNGLRHDIESEVDGARFESEMQLTLGRISLGLVRAIVPEEEKDEELAILKEVKKVEIAVYETITLPSPTEGEARIPGYKSLKRKGWQTIMTATESDGGRAWVLARERDGSLREILVGSLDRDELTMVKIHGDVERMIQRLQEEGILDVPGVVHADMEPEEGEDAVTVEAGG